MSIKSLFGNNDVTLKYLSEKNEKDAFSEVESDRNLKAIKSKHRAYIPQIDYTNPSNICKIWIRIFILLFCYRKNTRFLSI